jgi:CubicO group peptidase (beta-lactamase class C family)
VAAVVEDGQITALGAAGVRKAGSAAALTPYDLIHLGSDTKAMTAVLIGQLIDKRQLAFGSTIAQVFPDLAARMNAAMAKVTVQELLCHTGGWIVADRPWADGTAYTHSGSNTMCFCTAWIAPGKNFATLVPINYGGEDAFQTCDEATGALIQFHESHSGGGR